MQYGDHVQVGESYDVSQYMQSQWFHPKSLTKSQNRTLTTQYFLLDITMTGDTTNRRSNPKPTENRTL